MRRTAEQPRLRKREIAFAVAMGVVAAGGAAALLDNESGEVISRQVVSAQSDKTYQLADFDEIATVGPQDVQVTYGDTISVRAEGSPEALSWLEPVVVNGRLTIKPKNEFNWGNWRSLEPAKFYVTLPRLDSVAVAGSGDIAIDRIEGSSFEGTIAGPGSLSIAAMKVDSATFSIGASGNVTAAGTARDTHINVGASGEVKAGSLRSETASIAVAGSGDVALTVNDDAKVSIVGSGDVDITGPGRCSVTRMGGGDVRCAGGGGTDNDD